LGLLLTPYFRNWDKIEIGWPLSARKSSPKSMKGLPAFEYTSLQHGEPLYSTLVPMADYWNWTIFIFFEFAGQPFHFYSLNADFRYD
jgi:hypothetical protein